MARPRRGGRALISRRTFLTGAACTPLLGVLAACTGSTDQRVVTEPEQFLRTRWLDDPYARGSHSYLPIGASSADRSALAAPIDRSVFFAGEATSVAQPGTVRGAVESGRRAVSEMLAAGAGVSTRVVVVGAGAAGLAAASELRSAGITPVVLEARERVGGRVHTDRSLGMPVDLGAAFVFDPSSGNPLVALARQAGVALDAVDDDLVLRDARGRRRGDRAQVQERLTTALGRVGAGAKSDAELAAAVRAEAALVGLRDPELTWALAALVDELVGAAATEWAWRGYDEARRAVGSGAPGFGTPGSAAPGSGTPGAGTVARARPRGGFAALLAPLADGVDIRLGQVVRRVEWSRARPRVVTTGAEWPFDMVLVTLPLGVLQTTPSLFDPPLPVSTAAAIRRLGTGLVDTLVLRFADAFWDRSTTWLGGLGPTPGEWPRWWNLLPGTDQPVLVGTNSALVARTLDARTDDQLLAGAMSALRLQRA